MQLYNPYTRGYIEYPLYFEPEKLSYQIRHETPFTERFSEWAVSIIETGDVIYIPCGQNRCRNIYIVTRFYLDKTVTYPRGIYTIPISYFTNTRNNTKNNNEFDDTDMFDADDYFEDDEDDYELDEEVFKAIMKRSV